MQQPSSSVQPAGVRPAEASRASGRAFKWLLGAAILGAVLAAFAYWGREPRSSQADASALASAPPPVRVAAAVRRDMPVVERTLGTVLANTAVQVTARVQGVIMAAHFREGDFVKAGDLLFEIDPRPYEAALAQARAQLAKDEAQLQNAETNERRLRAVYEQHLTSSEQLDAAVAATRSARATVDADRAQIKLAELNLDYTKIRAPVDGETGAILVHPGNLVSANGSAPLVTINQVQPIKVSFALPQSDLPRIQARAARGGLVATVDQRGVGGGAHTAPVDFVGNHVDETSGTIELRATFPNDDFAFVPGQLVDVTVELAEIEDATVVPREAVNTGTDGLFTYVVTPDSRAQARTVRVLFDDGKDVAIAGNVRPGDAVMIEGQLRVVPGSLVSVDRTAEPTAVAAGATGARTVTTVDSSAGYGAAEAERTESAAGARDGRSPSPGR